MVAETLYSDFHRQSRFMNARLLRAEELPLHLPNTSLAIVYSEQDDIHLRIQGEDFLLRKNSILFINTQTEASIQEVGENGSFHLVVVKRSYFRPVVLRSLAPYPLFQSFIQGGGREPRRSCSHMVCTFIPIGFRELLSLFEILNQGGLMQAMEELFFPLVAVFDDLRPDQLQIFRNHRRPSHEMVSDKVREILDYIDEHYSTVNLSDIASRYNYSPNYLSNLIRLQSGATFGQHLSKRRLSVAKDLLENSPLDISEIIKKVGYSDKSSFYRQFKRAFRCTPSEMRR